MSEYAYHDSVLRAKLAAKGEAILAEPGALVLLETSGLKVQVRVTELEYGVGELPPNSYFGRLVMELATTAKPPQARSSS
jgi:hypothetical protein